MNWPKWSERTVFAVAVAMAGVALTATLKRIQLGVDYGDEAYYVALPYRFAMGDRPFVDELNIVQTCALFLYPFVKLYTMFAGTTGIFLYMRLLFVAFCGCVGASAFSLASERLSRTAALIIGACCIAFIPYSVPALSYNTLGMGLLSIGVFTSVRWLLVRPDIQPRLLLHPLFWSAFALAAAAFAYPPLAVPGAISGIALLWFASDERAAAIGRFVAGGVGFVLAMSPVLIHAGLSSLRATMRYSSEGGGGADKWARLSALRAGWHTDHPDFFFGMAFVALVALMARRWPRTAAVLLLGMPWMIWDTPIGPRSGAFLSARYLAGFALHAPFLAFAVKDKKSVKVLMGAAWMPSLVAGFLTAWMSGNAATASIVGLFPGVIVTAILAQMVVQESFGKWRAWWPPLLASLAPCVLLACLIRQEWDEQSVYYDTQLMYLTERIPDGPYKGLHASFVKKQWLMNFSRDIKARGMGDRALFYYDFPAGYLIANRKPLSSSTWTQTSKPRCATDADYFMEHATNGELVVKVNAAVLPTAVDRAVQDHCGPMKQEDGYSYCFVQGMRDAP